MFSPVRVGLVRAIRLPSVRDAHCCKTKALDSARRLSTSIKTTQLRKGRAFSRLRDQEATDGDMKRTVPQEGLQNVIVKGARSQLRT